MTDLTATATQLPALEMARERISPADAIQLWIATLESDNTRRAYRQEADRFARWLDRPVDEAMQGLLALDNAQGHTLIDAYRVNMQQRELAAASINRAMGAIKSFVKAARRYGLTELRIEPVRMKAAPYRDTRGPGLDGVRRMIAVAKDQSAWKSARDEAIIRLAFGLGLRRAEITSLDLAHVNLGTPAILSVKGKGESTRRNLVIPDAALAALRAWIEQRGDAKGPLFHGVDSKGARISDSGLQHVIAKLGDAAGMKVRPHGLRHAAITAALDATNGDIRKAQAFARHAKPSTTMVYDDNRTDLGGAAARIVDALVE